MRSPPSLLVTAFGPFGPHATNPSWEAARALDGVRLGAWTVRAARLDVAYARAGDQLRTALAMHRPDAVVSLGVAPERVMRLETRAANGDTSPEPDVDGVRGEGRPVREGGPETIATRLPLAAVARALEASGFPVRSSDDAGGYLCNHVFYALLDTTPPAMPAGFVHVPVLEAPWTHERLVEAVRVVLETVVEGADGAETRGR